MRIALVVGCLGVSTLHLPRAAQTARVGLFGPYDRQARTGVAFQTHGDRDDAVAHTPRIEEPVAAVSFATPASLVQGAGM